VLEDRQARFRAPSLPPNAVPFAFVAILICALVMAFAWWVLWSLRGVLQSNQIGSSLTDVLLGAVGLVPTLLFIPAFRGLSAASRARKHLQTEDLINARVATANASNSSWIAMGYSVFVLLAFGAVAFLIANNVAVGSTFFKLSLMWEKLAVVSRAFLTNIFIFCVAEVFILIWGLIIAVARMIPGRAGYPIRLLATIYTDVFRGLPSIITIYLIGFGLSLTELPLVSGWSPEWYAILTLTLTYGAYVAEVYRAGIDSIHPSQMMAARSLGLSFGQTMRHVIVPQAIRRIIPPLLNDFIGLQKDTALVNVIGTIDAFNQAKILASNSFNLSTVTIVALLFVLITIPQARFVDRLLEHDATRTRGAR
jgi:polar amino acid transport system permease protein